MNTKLLTTLKALAMTNSIESVKKIVDRNWDWNCYAGFDLEDIDSPSALASAISELVNDQYHELAFLLVAANEAVERINMNEEY